MIEQKPKSDFLSCVVGFEKGGVGAGGEYKKEIPEVSAPGWLEFESEIKLQILGYSK